MIPQFVKSLDPSFLTPFKTMTPPWGPVGYVTWGRTYPRKIDEDCECPNPCVAKEHRIETFFENVKRCCEAIGERGAFTRDELETLFTYWFTLKCSGAGRHWWMLGTKCVDRIGADSLQNCWFVACKELKAFLFAFDQLMLGGGVGFSVQAEHIYKLPPVKHLPDVRRVESFDCDLIVTDNREGWWGLLDRVFQSFFNSGARLHYTVRCLRPRGARIKTFGGTASGGEILVEGITSIVAILRGAVGRQLNSVECLDIYNIIGSIVVAGNVRRSSEIAIGDAHDLRFIEAKRWDKIQVPAWRGSSNNTIACENIRDLPEAFWENYNGEGEPVGLLNIPLMRKVGRLIDGIGYRPDPRILGTNPCGEISLEHMESCVGGLTLIQHRNGVEPIQVLVGREVEIWNGQEWSKVSPRLTGRNRELYLVTLTDGSSLECTDNHKWSAKSPTRSKFEQTTTMGLHSGDILEGFDLWNASGIHDENAYELGLFIGDGFIDGERPLVSMCGEKQKIQAKGTWYKAQKPRGRCIDGSPLQSMSRLALKGIVDIDEAKLLNNKWLGLTPYVFSLDKASINQFVAGWIDTDGSISNKGSRAEGYRIYGSLPKMRDLQILLRRIGISHASVHLMQEAGSETNFGTRHYDLWYCQIPSYECEDIPTRLKVAVNFGHRTRKNPAHAVSAEISIAYNQRVVSIVKLEGKHDTYCFDEPKRHMGVFNNVLTYQCNLGEIVLPNISDREFFTAAELITKVCKTVSCIPHHYAETREVVERNHRLGVGVTGFLQALDKHRAKLFDDVYRHIEETDRKYSKLMGTTPSVKLTTVKPSGTLSLLPGVTPGVHAAFGHHYIRRIQFAANDRLVDLAREHGYFVEPKLNIDGTRDLKTIVVEFPCKTPDGTIVQDELTAIDQLEHQLFLQKHWSDNSVSCTVQYWPEELPRIKDWLGQHYNDGVKSISFLLRGGLSGFKQMPYEEISEVEYLEMRQSVQPITEGIETYGTMSDQECAGGYCPAK